MSTATLRPDGAGDDTNWTPNTGANYAAVDEAVSDNDTTYVENTSTSALDDLYNIATDAALTGASISNVTIYAYAKYASSGVGSISAVPNLKLGVKASGTEYWDTGDDVTSSYALYTHSLDTNPADSAAWEKADIDALQIGIRSAAVTGASSSKRSPRVTQIYIVVTYTAGGTTYYETPAGELTSSGVVVLQARKVTAGGLTSSGGLVNSARKILAGALSFVGTLANGIRKVLSGELTSSGILAAVKIALVNLAGELTSSGALVNSGRKVLAGAVSSSGVLVNKAGKILSGAVTSAGVVIGKAGKVLSGSLTSSGIVGAVKTALVSLGGELTPSGALILSPRKILSGALTSAGALISRAGKALSGAVTSSGTLANSARKVLSGVMTSSGTVTKRISKILAGALSFIGTLVATLVGGEVNVPGTGAGRDTGNQYGAGGDVLTIGTVITDAATFGSTGRDTSGHVGAGNDEET